MRAGRAAVTAGSTAAAILTAHTAWNLRHLRRAPHVPAVPATTGPGAAGPRVTVLLPARDEAHRIAPALLGLVAQDLPGLRVIVLDDDSADGTAEVVRGIVGHDPRFEVLAEADGPPPPGWLGKPWACHRLAARALAAPADEQPDLLAFIDADVVLEPDALRRVVALMAGSGLDLACPYPRQEVGTPAERLIQPLLQWSWLTTLPLAVAERSTRPSLTAANGQLLVVRTQAYQRCGGHGAVRAQVLEDIALARAVKAAGGRATVTDGTDLATCRMYVGRTEVVDGYAKSLWAAFGSPAGAMAASALLTLTYVLPPLAALAAPTGRTRAIGAAGYAAAVAGRVMVARRTGQHAVDALSHPLAILALDGLTALSLHRRRRGTIRWKGRAVGDPAITETGPGPGAGSPARV